MSSGSSYSRYAVYLAHGVAVWMAAGLLHFPLFVVHPLTALLHPGKPLLVYLLLILAGGELLGTAIYLTMRFCDQIPGRVALHVILPLAAAVLVAIAYARLAGYPGLYPEGRVLPLSSLTTRMWTAIVLSLAATPAIIIRSSRMAGRLGNSAPHNPRKDPRWRI